MNNSIRHYDFIDALRGYAILMVLMVHSAATVTPDSAALAAFAKQGALGVQLFYAASALTLSMSWYARAAGEVHPVGNFFIRRFCRIAPMFYVAIVAYLLIVGTGPRKWAPDGIAWWHVVMTFLFLHGALPDTINEIVPGGWSIAVESTFYLLFPLLIARVTSTGRALVFLAAALVAVKGFKLLVLRALSARYPPSEQYLVAAFMSMNIIAQLPTFAVGMLVYFLFKNVDRIRRGLIAADLAVLTICIGAWMFHMNAAPAFLTPYSIVLLLLALFTLTLAAFPLRLLVNPVIRYIGKISYSMYLTQFAVLYAYKGLGLPAHFAKDVRSSILYFFLLLVGTIIVSQLTYSLVERSGIAWGRRLIARREGATWPR